MSAQTLEAAAARALAFAAMTQAATLVRSVAQGQGSRQDLTEYLLASVLRLQTPAVGDLYPPGAERRAMVRTTIELLSGGNRDLQVLGYNMELLELARRLRNHADVVAKLQQLLAAIPATATATATAERAELAQIYQQTISTLGRRIQVTGDPEALQQPENANCIRALLLAGVRGAWLWAQLGGRRWHLVIGRRSMLNHLQRLDTDYAC